MSTDKGYIKVYRDIREHWIWTNEKEPFDKLHAWLDLIMMVNHEDKEILFSGRLTLVKRGSRITSLRKLSERWHWSPHKVSDFLNILEKDGMISQVRNSQKTLITLINYGFYQGKGKQSGTPKEHSGNTEGTQKERPRNTQGNKQYIKKNEEVIKKKEEKDSAQLTDEELKERGWLD